MRAYKHTATSLAAAQVVAASMRAMVSSNIAEAFSLKSWTAVRIVVWHVVIARRKAKRVSQVFASSGAAENFEKASAATIAHDSTFAAALVALQTRSLV